MMKKSSSTAVVKICVRKTERGRESIPNMAYAAVTCLAQTINRLLNSCHISIIHSFPEIIVFEDDELEPLQDVLRRLDRASIRSERLSTLDGEIREAAYKLEDVMETLVSNQFLSHQSQDAPPFSISLDLEELKQYFESFKQTVKKMKEEYIEELNMPRKDTDDAQVQSTPETEGKNSKMVGLSALVDTVREYITDDYIQSRILLISGKAGIGKTTIAREVFEDPEIADFFKSRAWVRVGREYQPKEMFRSILSQLSQETGKILTEQGDEGLAGYLRETLQGRRCLIVLDDIWESQACGDLKELLPDNGSQIMVTSTMDKVIDRSIPFVSTCKMPFLNKEESWLLLREKMFGDQQEESLCPRELEKAGKKIAEKCDGLPLLIVTVASILSKAEKTVEYWNEVAEKKNSVFPDAYDQVSKALLPSYNYLPQNLKPCFLYIGILPLDYEFSRSSLINLWRAEGFLSTNNHKTFEIFATECLEELVSRNVVILRQKVTVLPLTRYNTEKYHLHSAFLHLCVNEAGKNKFYQVLTRYTEDAIESMQSQRSLCIQNNVLFAIHDMYNSMSSISAARSLLCTGPYHPYHVPICFGLRLLRVLDSLTIRFYEFPVEVLELIQLRYFAMTYDGELPASISKLWNLECLIVNRHNNLKSSGAPSYMPMEIWDMKELKHLQVMGIDLPDPSEKSVLPSLLTLLDVSQDSCTQRVLERIPNLRRLGIRTGLMTSSADPMSCFDNIHHSNGLEALALIVDLIPTSKAVARPLPPSIIDSHLRKLSLSGLGYPWEHMRLIGVLPNLEVLKLRCNACRGPEWETPHRGFQSLAYLLIEDSDLVVWTYPRDSFYFLKRLSLKHCYQLKVIPERLENTLYKIEVIDCNPSVVSWAKQIKSETSYYDVYIHSSWE